MISPAGIYASDHDMFSFLVNEEYRIDDGSDGGLARGFFVQNSEVGAENAQLARAATLNHHERVRPAPAPLRPLTRRERLQGV